MTENHVTNTNFARLCRCCASEHNLMYDIFCGTCSNAQTYYEVVMECASVQLYRQDGLPSLVCQKCVLVLESFVVFRRKCIESESIFKQMRDNVSPDRQELFDVNRVKRDDPILDNIKEESDDIDDTIEPLAEFDVLDKNTLGEKCVELKFYDEIKIENTTVNENYIDTYSQVGGIDQRLFENSIYVKEECIDDDCDESVKRYLDTNRTEERVTIEKQPYSNDESDKTFNTKANHRIVHADKKPYPCDVCGKSYKRKWTLSEHRKTHAGKKPYPCDECDKLFVSRSYLNHHRRVHTGERPYTCDQCDKSFSQKSTLNEHRKTHRSAKPYTCDACDKSFRHKSTFTEHRKVHTGERPHSCEVCDKSFRRKWSLVEHRNVHTGDELYPCDGCARSFRTKSTLREHRKAHAVVKPYACDGCERAFVTRAMLGRHRQLHVDEKPHACDQCDKSFCRKTQLAKHWIAHYGEKPFSCDKCDMSFNLKQTLRRHQVTHTYTNESP